MLVWEAFLALALYGVLSVFNDARGSLGTDTGGKLASLAAMAKCFATDTAMKVATDAVQLFGAAGISNEMPINRYFRDAKVLQIVEGTNQIQRNIISRNLVAD